MKTWHAGELKFVLKSWDKRGFLIIIPVSEQIKKSGLTSPQSL